MKNLILLLTLQSILGGLPLRRPRRLPTLCESCDGSFFVHGVVTYTDRQLENNGTFLEGSVVDLMISCNGRCDALQGRVQRTAVRDLLGFSLKNVSVYVDYVPRPDCQSNDFNRQVPSDSNDVKDDVIGGESWDDLSKRQTHQMKTFTKFMFKACYSMILIGFLAFLALHANHPVVRVIHPWAMLFVIIAQVAIVTSEHPNDRSLSFLNMGNNASCLFGAQRLLYGYNFEYADRLGFSHLTLGRKDVPDGAFFDLLDLCDIAYQKGGKNSTCSFQREVSLHVVPVSDVSTRPIDVVHNSGQTFSVISTDIQFFRVDYNNGFLYILHFIDCDGSFTPQNSAQCEFAYVNFDNAGYVGITCPPCSNNESNATSPMVSEHDYLFPTFDDKVIRSPNAVRLCKRLGDAVCCIYYGPISYARDLLPVCDTLA